MLNKILYLFLGVFAFFVFSQTYTMQRVHRIAARKLFTLHIKKRNPVKKFLNCCWQPNKKQLLEQPLIEDVSMQSDSEYEEIKGELMLVPGGLKFYHQVIALPSGVSAVYQAGLMPGLMDNDMTMHSLYDLSNNQIKVNMTDVVATVLIQSPECSHWGRYKHPRLQEFPLYLPVSLFINKKEGDTVSFLFQPLGSKKKFKIALTCHQLEGSYYSAEKFEDVLVDSLHHLNAISSLKRQLTFFYDRGNDLSFPFTQEEKQVISACIIA